MRKFLSNIYTAFMREIGHIRHNVTYMVILFVLPIIALIFFAIFLMKGVPTDFPIAVLDADHTTLSRQVVSMIDQTQSAKVEYNITDINEGIDLIHKGKVYAILQIPNSFEKSILNNKQTTIQFYNSGANISTNSLLARDVQTAVTSFNIGVAVQLLQKQGLTVRQAMAQAMPIRFSKHILFNPYTNYGYYLAPCFMPMMLLIFTIMCSIFAFGSELKNSTAKKWLDNSGNSIMAAIIGKMLPITIIMFLVAIVMYFILFNIVGVPFNGSLSFLLLATIVFIISYQCIGIFAVALTANLRLALSFGGGYSVLAFTFSGLTFPIMAMDTAMQWFSKLFPFSFYMRIIIDQVIRGSAVAVSLPDIGYMMLFWIFPLITLNLLKKECLDKKYWGRV